MAVRGAAGSGPAAVIGVNLSGRGGPAGRARVAAGRQACNLRFRVDPTERHLLASHAGTPIRLGGCRFRGSRDRDSFYRVAR
jgi:hypothetical protein